MAILPDPLGLFTDSGGGGGGGAGGFDEFLDFLKKQQSELKELTEREREQAKSFASLRRGELADRTGFAGLVGVGEALRRTDVTVAAEINLLEESDPQRIAFQEATIAETQQRAKQTRVITGEQFRAEDALAALEERLEEVGDPGRFGGENVLIESVEEISSELEEFREEFEFFDTGGFESDIQARLDELIASRERRKRRKPPRQTDPEGSDRDLGGSPGVADTGLGEFDL